MFSSLDKSLGIKDFICIDQELENLNNIVNKIDFTEKVQKDYENLIEKICSV